MVGWLSILISLKAALNSAMSLLLETVDTSILTIPEIAWYSRIIVCNMERNMGIRYRPHLLCFVEYLLPYYDTPCFVLRSIF